MNAAEFEKYCRNEIRLSFINTKAGKTDDKQKYRTEGVIHAARLLGVMSLPQITTIIEEEHMDIFGETVASRRARKTSFEQLKQTSPDDYYEVPAFERKR